MRGGQVDNDSEPAPEHIHEKNVEVTSALMLQYQADWENSPHTTSSKKENLSNATISIKPSYAMDANSRQEHGVGVPLPL